MSIDYAMIYEYIVRKANNNCGRFGTAGANADIYRHLERVWSKGKDDKYRSTAEERVFALGVVSTFLRDSIERLIKSKTYSEDINKDLQDIYDTLSYPSLAEIDAAVSSMANILKI